MGSGDSDFEQFEDAKSTVQSRRNSASGKSGVVRDGRLYVPLGTLAQSSKSLPQLLKTLESAVHFHSTKMVLAESDNEAFYTPRSRPHSGGSKSGGVKEKSKLSRAESTKLELPKVSPLCLD